jgi:hypothetical protein
MFMRISKWRIGAFISVLLVAAAILIFGGGRLKPFATPPLRVSLLSNREVAGLEFAYFTLSNRSARSVRYLRDRKAEEASYSLIERSVPDPSTGRITITNHNQSRLRHIVPAELPPHASDSFTVRYPSTVTNAVLMVSYRQTRTRFQLFLHNLTARVSGKAPFPTDAYETIELKCPFKPGIGD